MAEKAVLCAGHANYDVVLHTTSVPDPDHSSPITGDHTSSGGSATNTALALASFDVDVSMLGGVGDDEYAEFVQEDLKNAGVNPILKETDVPTTVVYALITEGADPRYLAKDEDTGDFDLNAVPSDRFEQVEHVHLTSFNEDIGGSIAQQASDSGKTVSFNPSQGYKQAEFPDIVDAADVIFLNEREANIFRSRYDFEDVVEDAVVVMTHGAAGATAYTPHGVVTHSGYESKEVADTIGAGDAFVAGFLSEWLKEDDFPDIKQSLAKANAAGAYTVTCVGAPNHVDTEYIETLIDD